MAGLTDGYCGALIDFLPDATVVVDGSAEERLRAVLREHTAEPAAAMIDAVLAAVDEFATGEPQFDEMTVMVIRGV